MIERPQDNTRAQEEREGKGREGKGREEGERAKPRGSAEADRQAGRRAGGQAGRRAGGQAGRQAGVCVPGEPRREPPRKRLVPIDSGGGDWYSVGERGCLRRGGRSSKRDSCANSSVQEERRHKWINCGSNGEFDPGSG